MLLLAKIFLTIAFNNPHTYNQYTLYHYPNGDVVMVFNCLGCKKVVREKIIDGDEEKLHKIKRELGYE